MKYIKVFESFLFESNKELTKLKDYLIMSDDDRALTIPYSFKQYLQEYIDYFSTDIKYGYNEELDEQYVNEYYQLNSKLKGSIDDKLKQIKNKYPKLLKEIGYKMWFDLKTEQFDIQPEDLPAWLFFEDIEDYKNNWLIHFTNYADNISKEGFKYGMKDIESLGLTTLLPKNTNGYNFAYDITEFKKFGLEHNKYKYGNQAVMFVADGIKAYHNKDFENQVIFVGKKAKNIIPITPSDAKLWSIKNKKTNEIIIESDDLNDIVKWVIKNYNKYKKLI